MHGTNKQNFRQTQGHRFNGFTRPAAWLLHHGRSRRPMLRVVPDDAALYRIEWPDIGLSQPANLTRCKQAALEWAAQRWLTDHRNLSVAQRLKSFDNFSWSASPMRLNGAAYGSTTPAPAKTNEGAQ